MNVAELRCSFCNKSGAEVKKLIAGPRDVAICDECVALCSDIVTDKILYRPMDDTFARGAEPDPFFFMCPECGHKWKERK